MLFLALLIFLGEGVEGAGLENASTGVNFIIVFGTIHVYTISGAWHTRTYVNVPVIANCQHSLSVRYPHLWGEDYMYTYMHATLNATPNPSQMEPDKNRGTKYFETLLKLRYAYTVRTSFCSNSQNAQCHLHKVNQD